MLRIFFIVSCYDNRTETKKHFIKYKGDLQRW